jgi:predicted nucleic acid-binding protein
MILIHVNVLVYAHQADAPNHRSYLQWLESILNADSAFGISELVLSGFLRVVTHPRIFLQPTPLESALAFIEAIEKYIQWVTFPVSPNYPPVNKELKSVIIWAWSKQPRIFRHSIFLFPPVPFEKNKKALLRIIEEGL